MSRLFAHLQAPAGRRLGLSSVRALAKAAVEVVGHHVCPVFPPHGRPRGWELSLVVSDDATVRQLNATHRGKDRPTNVLSFENTPSPDDPRPYLGDIILAAETIRREAAEQNKPVADHFTHLVVHGVLHLYGFDHLTDSDAETMEDLERRLLRVLNIPDPYEER
jgi:probable rRNA maturation factor